jgi:hypothetical protein
MSLRSSLRWATDNRHLVAALGCLIGAILLKQAYDLQPVGLDYTAESTVRPIYIGKLDLITSRSGLIKSNVHSDAGYGIGIPNEGQPNPLLQALQPTRYIQFSPALGIDDADISRIGAQGHTSLTIKTSYGQIVAVGGTQGWIISYDDYVSRVLHTRRTYLAFGATSLLAAVGFWIASTIAARRSSTVRSKYGAAQISTGSHRSVPTDMQELARAFAIAAHADQKYGGRPYSFHLDAVAELAAPYGEDAVVIAYLHDTAEDTPVTLAEIESKFGAKIAACVALLTDEPGANRKERKSKTYAKLAAVEGPNETALLVKAADRLANVRACVQDRKKDLWLLYQSEHAAFKSSAYRPGQCEPLWTELDSLLSDGAFDAAT